jgi:hypothetical protein
MNWKIIKSALLHGWTLERDPVTDEYIFGSVPHLVLKHWNLCTSYTRRKVLRPLNRIKNAVVRRGRSFATNHPYIMMAFTGAAATVGYFMFVGVAWTIAFKALKWMRVF